MLELVLILLGVGIKNVGVSINFVGISIKNVGISIILLGNGLVPSNINRHKS